MQSQNTLNKLSRRNWLRDAAIATTGAALMPSLLTSCSDHRIPPVVGVGVSNPTDEPLTRDELYSASQNLVHMVDWLRDLHISQADYEIKVLEWLKSGDKPSGWSDFIINILLDIAVGVITAAAEAATAGAATAVFAITSELIKKFAFSENRPHDLDGVFAEFKDGQDKLYEATKKSLLILADEGHPSDKDYPYQNLKDTFKGGGIDFNGKKYTLRDLANSHFPTETNGTEYVTLFTAAFDKFRRNIWNVMFIKAADMSYSIYWAIIANQSPALYARDTHYPKYPETYLRGRYEDGWNTFGFRSFYFTIDGRYLSAGAARELFIDDYPGHIMNPDPDPDPKKHGKPLTGLFPRDYVFKQFHREKPDYFGYADVRSDLVYDEGDPYNGKWNNFSHTSFNYEFTGGEFPQLVKK